MSLTKNILALKILSMLVTPFDKTDAFKYGVIDADGKRLRNPSDLKTPEEKSSYTFLERLVFNIKRLIGKLPGGNTKLANIVAAYFLVKEHYDTDTEYSIEYLSEQLNNILDMDFVPIEETLDVINFFSSLNEEEGNIAPADTPANKTGSAISTDIPLLNKFKQEKPKLLQRKKKEIFPKNDDTSNNVQPNKEISIAEISSLLPPPPPNSSVSPVTNIIEGNTPKRWKMKVNRDVETGLISTVDIEEIL